jgi:glycolate oxidase
MEASGLKQHVVEAIGEVVSPDRISRAETDTLAASYDASDWRHQPEVVVWPLSAAEVSAVLKLANRYGFAVVARGAGTGLVGSVIPVRGGVVLDMNRMNRIIDVRLDDRLVVVEPGVIYRDLDRRLEPLGFFFPPDPASGPSCTLGGNVATNAGGIRGAKYGTTKDYLLGLEVVLPQGEIIRTGSRTMKCVSGIPLTGLFCGSEGVLGVITEITFKISPRPRAKTTALILFDRLADAGAAIGGITRAGVIPAVLELMDKATIDMLIDAGGFDLPRVETILLMETDGFTTGEAQAEMEEAVRICRELDARDIQMAETPEDAALLWTARRSIGPVSIKRWPNGLVEDVTVPMSKIPELLEEIQVIANRRQVDIINFGHCGDGNLHPQIMFDASQPGTMERAEEAAADIFALACRLGGTLSGEHGIGLAKAPYLKLEHQPPELEVMASLKKLFDPGNILNPGKIGLEF